MISFIPEGMEPKQYIHTSYVCDWCGESFTIAYSINTLPMYRSKPSRCSGCTNRLGYLASALESQVKSMTFTASPGEYTVSIEEMRAMYAKRAAETRDTVKRLWPGVNGNKLVREECMAYASRHDIPLTREDFTEAGGSLTIDGMDPREWVIAMTVN